MVSKWFFTFVPFTHTRLVLARYAEVFAELPPDAALVEQAEDRVHRRGQVGSVNVYFLVAHGAGAGADERRWGAIERSLDRVRQAMDAENVGEAKGLMPEAFGTKAMLPEPRRLDVGEEEVEDEEGEEEEEEEGEEEEEEEEEKHEPPPPPSDLWFELSPHTVRAGRCKLNSVDPRLERATGFKYLNT